MAGFRKAKAEQAAVKMALFGPSGSGKTFTALLFAEGIAKLTGRRVAVVDTERGTDFYCQAVPQRSAHPEAFDFDAIYTRSLTEVVREVKGLRPESHCAVVIDSMTHLWEAAIAAYDGPRTRIGSIPNFAWGRVKKPYKELMQWVINTPLHVFLLGRQGNEWADNEETGESVSVGYKMKAEGETQYEPHVCLRMASVKPTPGKGKRPRSDVVAVPTAYAEKDRSGVLQGRQIPWPTFDNVIAPLLGLLGQAQAQIQADDEAAFQDAEALRKAESEHAAGSHILKDQFTARFILCGDLNTVECLAKEITPAVKKQLTAADLSAVRSAYAAARHKFTTPPQQPPPQKAPDDDFDGGPDPATD